MVTDDLSLTSIKTVNVSSKQNGASVRLSIDDPGLAFEAHADINDDKPIFSSAFVYGMVIAPEDYYYSYLNENLVPTANKSVTADIQITKESDFYNAEEGVYKCGIMKMRDYNLARTFISRAYTTIKYTDGSSRTIYSEKNSLTRSVALLAWAISNNTDYYNSLPADQKAAVDYFKGFYN